MIRTWRGRVPKLHRRAFVHESAEIIGMVTLKDRASVWPLCSLRGDLEPIIIGERSNIQDLCVIHTQRGRPTRIGRGVTIGHNATLHGCRIGDRSLVGMGAIVMEADIGRGCFVAAGSLVLGGFTAPPGSLVMGSPARVVRRVGPKERAAIAYGARAYLKRTEEHLKTSRAVFS